MMRAHHAARQPCEPVDLAAGETVIAPVGSSTPPPTALVSAANRVTK